MVFLHQQLSIGENWIGSNRIKNFAFHFTEYVQWHCIHSESNKYLRLMEYLNQETFLENSPTLQRYIREYK